MPAYDSPVKPGSEGRVRRLRHPLVVPVAAARAIARRVAAVGKPHGRRPIEHEDGAEPRPAVLVVEETGHAARVELLGLEAVLVEHQRPQLHEEPEHGRRARPAVGPQDGRIGRRVAFGLDVE
eukprot:4610830-Prymnesium_polylepis.1